MQSKSKNINYRNQEIRIYDSFYFAGEAFDTLEEAKEEIDRFLDEPNEDSSWADEEERLYIEHWQHVSH